MSDTVIRVENLSKQYRLGEVGTGTISHDLNRWWAKVRGKEDPFSKIGEVNDRTKKGDSEYVWALRDINFEVKRGEVLGIIGRNGAGKSTLLKLLSKVTSPTTGSIRMKGRVASLLEVGTGFHPELTGRENVFLNGAILGMTKKEIQKKFDEIVDFAGVERYIDTPVKRYSSGMYVRLAFAVAAHLEPEILIVDEVLAVGDAEFQKKCLGKMNDVAQHGRTILFVSHNMGAVKGLCSRAILLGNGSLVMNGDIQETISAYLNGEQDEVGIFGIGRAGKEEQVIIEKIILRNQEGIITQNFNIGDDLIIELYYNALQRFEQPYFWIGIRSQYGGLFGANGLIDGYSPKVVEGRGKISCTFKNLPLFPQTYGLNAGIRDVGGNVVLSKTKDIGFFNIVTKISDIGFNGVLADSLSGSSSSPFVPYEWDFGGDQQYEVNIFKYAKR